MQRNFFFFFIAFPLVFLSQEKEKKFLEHLFNNRLYSEAELFLQSPEYANIKDPARNYALAFCYKKTSQPEKFSFSLQQIGAENPFYFRSRLWLQNQYLQTEKIDLLKSVFFDETSCPDSIAHLQRLNQAAMFGLAHDLNSFLALKNNSLVKKTPYVQNLNEMETALTKIVKYKKRKPFVAGLLSTFIPGLGKVYAQKPKQGISSMITVGIFALQTLEMYKKGNGFRNPGFYFYGSIFTAFYLGNILGSAHAAKKRNYDFIKEQEYEILRQADYPFRSASF